MTIVLDRTYNKVTCFKKNNRYAIGGFSGPPLPSTGGYNGNDLIRESGNGVVAVIIQYRLGAFGFLAGKEVKAGGDLNAGLCAHLIVRSG